MDFIPKMIENLPKTAVAADSETTDSVSERSLGTFISSSTANEAYGGSANCCLGNSARTIYYIWEHILDCKDGRLRVNLLLNRASPWADVYSSIPYEGRVDIKIKQPCKEVRVRMPEWVNATVKDASHTETVSNAVACRINGQAHKVKWEGCYIDVGAAQPGDKIEVTFPIAERLVVEKIGGVHYTMTIKGNTVVAIDPPGKIRPLYQRATYRQLKAPWVERERFVSAERISW